MGKCLATLWGCKSNLHREFNPSYLRKRKCSPLPFSYGIVGTSPNRKLFGLALPCYGYPAPLGSVMGWRRGEEEWLRAGIFKVCDTLGGWCLGLEQSAYPCPAGWGSIISNERLFLCIPLSLEQLSLLL